MVAQAAPASVLFYLWQKNGASLSDGGNISGSTTTQLTVANVSSSDLGTYSAAIWNDCKTTMSTNAYLMYAPVIITNQPANATVILGTSSVLSVMATGTNLTYQWLLNGTNIPGATSANYTNPFVQFIDLGIYTVVVSNPGGSVTSSNAVWTVSCTPAAPNISGWWQGENNLLDFVNGHTATNQGGVSYSTGIVGTGFHFNGASNAFLTCGTNTGNFFTNDCTVELWLKTTNTATLTGLIEKLDTCWESVWSANGWEMRVNSGRLYIGLGDTTSPGSYTSAANSSSPLLNNGSWHHVAFTRNSAGINGYVDGVLYLFNYCPKIYSVHNAYNFRMGQSRCYGFDTVPFSGDLDEVTIYNGHALTSNEVAAVYAAGTSGKCCYGPVIITQPTSPQNIQASNTAYFSVSARATPTVKYLWQKNGAGLSDGGNIAGSTTSSLTVSNVSGSDLGTYIVTVSNFCTTVDSAEAYLVYPPPGIVTQPTNTPAALGSTAYLFVVASGSGLSYQWRTGTNPIYYTPDISGPIHPR